MIRIDDHIWPGLVAVRQQGDQRGIDIAGLATAFGPMTQGARVVFDWREADHWPCDTLDDTAIAACRAAGASIAAACIVHPKSLHRHAAWLAATLRICRVPVRCFRAGDMAPALAWLRAVPALGEHFCRIGTMGSAF